MKLFVGGFPLDIAEIELVKLFNSYGTVNTIKIVRDKKTRKCKGYAFLEMTDQAGADRAIENLDGTTMGDRILSVKQAADKPAPKPAPQGQFRRAPRPEGYNRPERSDRPDYRTDRSERSDRPANPSFKKRPRL